MKDFRIKYYIMQSSINNSRQNSSQSRIAVLQDSSYQQSKSSISTISQLIKSLQKSVINTMVCNNVNSVDVSEIKQKLQQSGSNSTMRNILLELSNEDSIYWEYMAQDIENIVEFASKSKENRQKLDKQNQQLLKQIRLIQPSFDPSGIDRSIVLSKDHKELKEKTRLYRQDYEKYRKLNGEYQQKIHDIQKALQS